MKTPINPRNIALNSLPRNVDFDISIDPSDAELSQFALDTGVRSLSKFRFKGRITPIDRGDWRLSGHLGATVVQDCRATLEPVRTRIEATVLRNYVKNWTLPDDKEIETPEDENAEPLPRHLDLYDVIVETLILEIPAFPRRAEIETIELTSFDEQKNPEEDSPEKPFAALEGLKQQIAKSED